jgi:predicted  nucleic acid-binding Zn-ribbon protein
MKAKLEQAKADIKKLESEKQALEAEVMAKKLALESVNGEVSRLRSAEKEVLNLLVLLVQEYTY